MNTDPVLIHPEGDSLFHLVAFILEQTRRNVVRPVNANMAHAYGLIGREIVNELQGGEERAEYGKQVIENLSVRLTERYEKGFSAPTLWNFLHLCQVYANQFQILSPPRREVSACESEPIQAPRFLKKFFLANFAANGLIMELKSDHLVFVTYEEVQLQTQKKTFHHWSFFLRRY